MLVKEQRRDDKKINNVGNDDQRIKEGRQKRKNVGNDDKKWIMENEKRKKI